MCLRVYSPILYVCIGLLTLQNIKEKQFRQKVNEAKMDCLLIFHFIPE